MLNPSWSSMALHIPNEPMTMPKTLNKLEELETITNTDLLNLGIDKLSIKGLLIHFK